MVTFMEAMNACEEVTDSSATSVTESFKAQSDRNPRLWLYGIFRRELLIQRRRARRLAYVDGTAVPRTDYRAAWYAAAASFTRILERINLPDSRVPALRDVLRIGLEQTAELVEDSQQEHAPVQMIQYDLPEPEGPSPEVLATLRAEILAELQAEHPANPPHPEASFTLAFV